MAKLEYLRIVLGMMTFLELAHMLDATQLCLSFPCTHAGCYTCHGVGGVGWGGDDESLNLHACWMLRNCVCLVLAHMLDATQLCLRTRSLKPMCAPLRGDGITNQTSQLANLDKQANNRAA